MPVTVVVGGQYGSEGKGKLVSYLASHTPPSVAVVRCGGPNAGHTAVGHGLAYQLRQLPSGVVDPAARLYLAAGMILDLNVLFDEIRICSVRSDRLMIDRNACVLDESDRINENAGLLRDRVGSTLSGTGSATARKVLRDTTLRLARDVEDLRQYVGNVSAALNGELDRGSAVIVEGTQGFGLSLHHASDYPFATSRDTTAAAFISEAGLSPLTVGDVYMVLRTFPIRVAGNSGPLKDETSWEYVTEVSGYPTPLAEFTTVTRKLRRVGRFDWDLVEEAARVNRPTGIALHGADYLDYADYGKSDWAGLSPRTRSFVDQLQERLGIPVDFVFTGPDERHIVDRRASRQFVPVATAGGWNERGSVAP